MGNELRAERDARGMTQTAFGRWLAELVGAKPYTQPRVAEWETGARPVPARVELAILKAKLARRKRAKRS